MFRDFIYVFLTLVCFSSYGQQIDIQIRTTKDSFNISEPINIQVSVINRSDKHIFLPAEFYVTSNLLPNGLENPISGFNLHFEINPAPNWASVHIENTTLILPQDFVSIGPNKSRTFIYDIGKHIRYLNKRLTTDSLKLPSNSDYTISTQINNNWQDKNNRKTPLTGKYESGVLNLYISE